MPRYAVDISCWIYLDAPNETEAFNEAHTWCANILENFEIVNVEDMEDDDA